MRQLLRAFTSDEDGFLISAELVLVCTLLVLGCIVGMAALSEAINTELNEIAESLYASFQTSPPTPVAPVPPTDLFGTGDPLAP
jgi:Flp pilus assembly pilin Flp